LGYSVATLFALASGAPDGVNIGGDGTKRDKATTYQLAGGRNQKMSYRINFYDKDVGTLGWELHGDVALSVTDAKDKTWFEMGWCFRPISESDFLNSFDCLQYLFFYSNNEIDVAGTPGHSENFIGHDLFAPRLNNTLMTPKDYVRQFLDKDIPANASSKSGAWTVSTSQSYKLCTSVGNCTFNAHFFRNFQTGDLASDYQITKGSNLKYEIFGYAAEYVDYKTSSATKDYIVGDLQNVYLERLTWQKKEAAA